MNHPCVGNRRPVPALETQALRCRPNLRRQVWSRDTKPLKGAMPVARQIRFHGIPGGERLTHFVGWGR